MRQSCLKKKKLFVDHSRRTRIAGTSRLVVAKKECDYTPRALPRVFVAASSLPAALSPPFFFHCSSSFGLRGGVGEERQAELERAGGGVSRAEGVAAEDQTSLQQLF
jgi:hypothetical protein